MIEGIAIVAIAGAILWSVYYLVKAFKNRKKGDHEGDKSITD